MLKECNNRTHARTHTHATLHICIKNTEVQNVQSWLCIVFAIIYRDIIIGSYVLHICGQHLFKHRLYYHRYVLWLQSTACQHIYVYSTAARINWEYKFNTRFVVYLSIYILLCRKGTELTLWSREQFTKW